MKTDGQMPADTKVRSSKYLNNLIEQDHRGVKLRLGPMLGFKWFTTAAIVIAGIELLRRIHKCQFSLGRLRLVPEPDCPCGGYGRSYKDMVLCPTGGELRGARCRAG
jgi:hypothetical protein